MRNKAFPSIVQAERPIFQLLESTAPFKFCSTRNRLRLPRKTPLQSLARLLKITDVLKTLYATLPGSPSHAALFVPRAFTSVPRETKRNKTGNASGVF